MKHRAAVFLFLASFMAMPVPALADEPVFGQLGGVAQTMVIARQLSIDTVLPDGPRRVWKVIAILQKGPYPVTEGHEFSSRESEVDGGLHGAER